MTIYESEGKVKPVHRPKRVRSEENVLSGLGLQRASSIEDPASEAIAIDGDSAVILIDEGSPDPAANENISNVSTASSLSSLARSLA